MSNRLPSFRAPPGEGDLLTIDALGARSSKTRGLMSKDKRPSRATGDGDRKPNGADPPLKPGSFDRWFKRQVHRIYDDTLGEPLPDRLKDLVDRFPSRDERPRSDRGSDNAEGDS